MKFSIKFFAIRFSFLFFAMFPIIAHGGPWISSGGDLKGDSINPWFLLNTPVVRYCISVDRLTSSASIEDIRSAFQKSVSFWQDEFTNNLWVIGKDNRFLFMPQFIEASCSEKVDLNIYVGEGSLNQKQKEFIQSLKISSVALAVRTDYDVVNLKGAGFIYLAGDKNKPEWISNAWKNRDRLTPVMTHELGHVLGVAHQQGDFAAVLDSTNNPEMFPLALNLMSESFPQAMVLEANNLAVSFAYGIMPILTGSNIYDFCDLSLTTRNWFQLTPETKCLKVKILPLDIMDSSVFAQVYAVTDQTFLIGSLQSQIKNPLLSSRSDVITQVYLTKQQSVFQKELTSPQENFAGGMQVSAHLQLRFVSSILNVSKPLLLDFNPTQITIMGIQDADFVKILSQKTIRPLLR